MGEGFSGLKSVKLDGVLNWVFTENQTGTLTQATLDVSFNWCVFERDLIFHFEISKFPLNPKRLNPKPFSKATPDPKVSKPEALMP